MLRSDMRRAALLLGLLIGCAENYSREADRTPAQVGALSILVLAAPATDAPEPNVLRIQPVRQAGDFQLRYGPQDFLDLAAWAGDYEGLLGPMKALDRTGLRHTGAGQTLQEALEGAMIPAQNVKVGLLSFVMDGERDSTAAWADRGGAAPFRFEEARLAIEQLRRKADVVIVRVHNPSNALITTQRRAALRALLESGADAVIGTPGSALDWELHNLRPLLLVWPEESPAPLVLQLEGGRLRRLSFEFEDDGTMRSMHAAGWKADHATGMASVTLPRL